MKNNARTIKRLLTVTSDISRSNENLIRGKTVPRIKNFWLCADGIINKPNYKPGDDVCLHCPLVKSGAVKYTFIGPALPCKELDELLDPHRPLIERLDTHSKAIEIIMGGVNNLTYRPRRTMINYWFIKLWAVITAPFKKKRKGNEK